MKILFDITENKEQYMHNGLRKYNAKKNVYRDKNRFNKKGLKYGFYAYINNHKVGGSSGWIDDGCWLYIDTLFVSPKYRNMDIGTKIIHEVEKFAKKHSCIGIRLETWEFQAKDFYKKQGFEVFGQLENHPPGSIVYFMKKVLITKEKDFPKLLK